MRLKNEDEILDEGTRKRIIEEIEGDENQRRKSMAYDRHHIWKDRTIDYVRTKLMMLLDPATVVEMEYALSNISITKKIIDKLAKVYANGVERSYEDDDENTEKLNALEKKLKATATMKTINKFLKLQRNTALYIKPTRFFDKNGDPKMRPSWNPLSPYLYDVVDEHDDRTRPMVFVLSNYDRATSHTGGAGLPEQAAHHQAPINNRPGDGTDQRIADKKEDEGEPDQKEYIWWSDKWHFTTRGSAIINPETELPFSLQDGATLESFIGNPLEEKPFVDFHIDQEGHYWAEGGSDLIDTSISINCALSNAKHIGVTQGYGQLVVVGSESDTFKLGPNKVITLPHDSPDDPTPSAQFITANPPLEALGRQIEMEVALLLTTNNLSTSGIASNLQGGMTAASGIALVIDKAESLEDVKDQREIFEDAEPDAWRITAKYLELFEQAGELAEELKDCRIPVEKEVHAQFEDAAVIMSEAEKLDALAKRKDLGLNTMIELVMKDRKLDKVAAEAIVKEVEEEKLERANSMGLNIDPVEDEEPDPNADTDEEDDSK